MTVYPCQYECSVLFYSTSWESTNGHKKWANLLLVAQSLLRLAGNVFIVLTNLCLIKTMSFTIIIFMPKSTCLVVTFLSEHKRDKLFSREFKIKRKMVFLKGRAFKSSPLKYWSTQMKNVLERGLEITILFIGKKLSLY